MEITRARTPRSVVAHTNVSPSSFIIIEKEDKRVIIIIGNIKGGWYVEDKMLLLLQENRRAAFVSSDCSSEWNGMKPLRLRKEGRNGAQASFSLQYQPQAEIQTLTSHPTLN